MASTKTWCADVDGPQKFVIPLSHHYTRTNVSFAGLKGDDLKTLSLLQNVQDPQMNVKLFSVYLALVTKHVTGTGEDDGYYDRYDRYGGGGYGGGGVTMSSDCDTETVYETDSWVGPHGAVDLKLKIDFDTEVLAQGKDEEEVEEVCEEMFGEKPDKVENEGYCGNYAGSLEYWYHSAVLVFCGPHLG